MNTVNTAIDVLKPQLRPNVPATLEGIPEATAFDAGYLVSTNGSWRSVRPVLNSEKCVGCLKCVRYCPAGAVPHVEKSVRFDLDFCKGCGICARICPAQAITMIAETAETEGTGKGGQ
jgi:pyruvate ferredoxin oxidoreductase delta subunit/pyruvate ferredoxin oxidoreductase gamma subunit